MNHSYFCGKNYSSIILSVRNFVNSTLQTKKIDVFLQEKKAPCQKKPSSSGNVCIRYLHLVVRREEHMICIRKLSD